MDVMGDSRMMSLYILYFTILGPSFLEVWAVVFLARPIGRPYSCIMWCTASVVSQAVQQIASDTRPTLHGSELSTHGANGRQNSLGLDLGRAGHGIGLCKMFFFLQGELHERRGL